ncbi:MAG: tRNA (adenosine(37)-N6)-threonylcarbamoyltransferase complex ATPase subunit type 1 TsaE [Flavobacteriales bacterium]|nr:MAG: tRNA (adenosine(37)-N6)-threonylcarbamoyltransferase complex ATPase subunit type 1 TsaE [Flavobacteriales bacterium]
MSKTEYIANSETDLFEIAKKMLVNFSDQKIILFYGEMGVGKTTLIKQLCKQLNVEESTNSPTFSIVNEYLSVEGASIYHFDFYRIEEETEVFDLGYEDYFYSGNYCFIEWPEKIPNLLPGNAVKVTIVQDEQNIRLISVVL